MDWIVMHWFHTTGASAELITSVCSQRDGERATVAGRSAEYILLALLIAFFSSGVFLVHCSNSSVDRL